MAAADRLQARPGGEASEVAGEDGQLRRAVRASVVDERKGPADPEEALREVPRGQDGGRQQLVPVGRDDSDGHHKDAAGPILQGLGYGAAKHDRRWEGVYDLAVGRAAHGAAAGGPVED